MKKKKRRSIPIIALTASAMREDIEKTAAACCDIHLSKPVRKANLLLEISKLLA